MDAKRISLTSQMKQVAVYMASLPSQTTTNDLIATTQRDAHSGAQSGDVKDSVTMLAEVGAGLLSVASNPGLQALGIMLPFAVKAFGGKERTSAETLAIRKLTATIRTGLRQLTRQAIEIGDGVEDIKALVHELKDLALKLEREGT